MSIKPVNQILIPQTVMDGAGVELSRVFGRPEAYQTDPFLLLDHFKNDDPDKYMAGFPWHPHRGIETITYVISGSMEHQDSMGNHGILGDGDVQWMTAGRGIIHQEMPKNGKKTGIHGFQLWANLPSRDKMMDPRYQDIPAGEIPEVTDDDGTRVRIITGEFWGRRGPVEGIVTEPRYLDVFIPPRTTRSIRVNLEHNAFAYVFEGFGEFKNASQPVPAPTEYVTENGATDPLPASSVEHRNLVLFDRGDEISVRAGELGLRFLLISGQPLREPIAWHGPIVMNTESEIEQAFREYQNGTFLK